MAGIVAAITSISLDLVTNLVTAGYVTAALAITAATNASPIVVTTATAHGVTVGQTTHGVIAGVNGNTAANGTFVCTAVTDTTLSLASMALPATTPVAVGGTGAYTSGGTISFALTDGKILIGKQHVAEASRPPRVVFVPEGSIFGPQSVANQWTTASALERQTQYAQRAIGSDKTKFRIHVWNANTPTPDPDLDWDATRMLYQAVYASIYKATVGSHKFLQGAWTDSTNAGPSVMNYGREFVFYLELDTPVTDVLLPLQPSGTVAHTTDTMQSFDGQSSDVGCTS